MAGVNYGHDQDSKFRVRASDSSASYSYIINADDHININQNGVLAPAIADHLTTISSHSAGSVFPNEVWLPTVRGRNSAINFSDPEMPIYHLRGQRAIMQVDAEIESSVTVGPKAIFNIDTKKIFRAGAVLISALYPDSGPFTRRAVYVFVGTLAEIANAPVFKLGIDWNIDFIGSTGAGVRDTISFDFRVSITTLSERITWSPVEPEVVAPLERRGRFKRAWRELTTASPGKPVTK